MPLFKNKLYRHAKCNPEEHSGEKPSPTVVLRVVLDGVLDDADVDEAADEEDEDGEVVSSPKERHALIVEINPLFFFGP